MIIHFTTRANLWLPSPPSVVQLKARALTRARKTPRGLGAGRQQRPLESESRGSANRFVFGFSCMKHASKYGSYFRPIIRPPLSHSRNVRRGRGRRCSRRPRIFLIVAAMLSLVSRQPRLTGGLLALVPTLLRGNAVCDAPRGLLEPRTTTHGTQHYRFGEAPFPRFLTCIIVGSLPVFTRPETVKIVGCRHNRLVIQQLETTRSVEDGIPTRSVGTSGELCPD